MMTREEYHKKLHEKADNINHRLYDKPKHVASYRLVHHQSNEAQIQSNPPENKTLDENIFDGFHQVLFVFMRGLHKIWKMFNSISFINNINKKQDASFKRNQDFMTSDWSAKSSKAGIHKKVPQKDNNIKHKSSAGFYSKPHKKSIEKANNKRHSNSKTSSRHQQHSVPLDTTFVNMMKHK